jgi:PAS domain S-box-containing protein
MNPSQVHLPTGSPGNDPLDNDPLHNDPVPLESILYTEELQRRPSRSPDYQTENRALVALAQALTDSPHTVLQTLADTILEVFQVGSAGLSVLTAYDGEQRFYWPAIAGAWKAHVGGGMPRNFSPCGDVLDRNAPLLFKHFERRYPYLQAAASATEALFIPFYVHGKAVGTLWVIAHDECRRFDAEDVRQLESLGRFAAAAYQAVRVRQASDSRRAALNLMEDAVQAQRLAENINRELCDEIIERQQAEALLQHQKEALEILAGAGPLLEVLNILARAVESQSRGPMMAAIHLLNPAGTHFACVAAPSLPAAYLQATEGLEIASRCGPCCDTVLSGASVGVADVAQDPRYPLFAEIAVQCGIRAGWSTPIFSAQSKVLATFTVYYREPREPSVRDRQMMAFISRTVTLAIERRQAEATLRQSEERYRTLTSVITDVPWTTDAQGAFITEQPAWMQYTGQTWQESRGFGWSNALHPDDREAVIAIWKRACETRSLYEAKGRLWHAPTQQYRHFVARATPLRSDDGDCREWVGSCTDVHEHVLAAQALRESEERCRTLADNMAQLAWTCDSLGNITWYNQRWLDYTGLSFAEMAGWGWNKVQHPDHLERVVAGVKRSAATGEPWEDTFPLRGKDGRYRWFLSRAVPIRADSGEIMRWFGTNTDVTEQREMEHRIKDQAAQLADESRRKDEFLAMLSHELRNPLAPIRSAVHLLHMHERGSGNRIQQQAREIIERQVGNLTKLVSDLLEVSRVVSGRIRLDQQIVDLNQVVRHATETVKPLIEQRQHDLVLNLCAEPTWVNADTTRLEEVFINLLNNAAKYTDEGGRIEVHCEHAGSQVQVRVRDNGVGIDKELLPRIFDLFTQADRSLARSAGGLGIGLSLAQRLVAMHGGTLEADSPPRGRTDHGSEFIVTLPRTRAPKVQQSAEPGAEIVSPRNGIRVLVVDDNIDQVTMLSDSLRHVGYNVQGAHTGPEGLEMALQWRPDIVLLDIGLPGLDGYEVARRLRSDPHTKSMRLIAFSGYARDTDIALAHEAGFDAHLSKPLAFDDLEKVIGQG